VSWRTLKYVPAAESWSDCGRPPLRRMWELTSALAAASAGTLALAVTIHAERADCEQQIAELGKQAKATSSKGASLLREDLAARTAELHRLGPANPIVLDETTLRAAIETAEASMVQVTSDRDHAGRCSERVPQ